MATFMAMAILGGAALQWPVGHYDVLAARREKKRLEAEAKALKKAEEAANAKE